VLVAADHVALVAVVGLCISTYIIYINEKVARAVLALRRAPSQEGYMLILVKGVAASVIN
jgi:hypothetical protein